MKSNNTSHVSKVPVLLKYQKYQYFFKYRNKISIICSVSDWNWLSCVIFWANVYFVFDVFWNYSQLFRNGIRYFFLGIEALSCTKICAELKSSTILAFIEDKSHCIHPTGAKFEQTSSKLPTWTTFGNYCGKIVTSIAYFKSCTA